MLPSTQEALHAHGLLLGILDASHYPEARDDQAIHVLAAHGRGFWDLMLTTDPEILAHADPVDHFSRGLAEHVAKAMLGEPIETLLYPASPPGWVPLMAFGQALGWSHPSPLGLGLHHQYGPWLAYRAAWLGKRTDWPDDAVATVPSPCVSCATKPCIQACPAGAVQADEPFAVDRCFAWRRMAESGCRLDCPARRACPVGVEDQYRAEQLGWHMLKAMPV